MRQIQRSIVILTDKISQQQTVVKPTTEKTQEQHVQQINTYMYNKVGDIHVIKSHCRQKANTSQT